MAVGIYFYYDKDGPGKVIKNIKRGFDLLGIDYKLNSDSDINIILQDCYRLHQDISNCIIGPNICTLPKDNEAIMKFKYNKLIVPSNWVKELYLRWVPEDKLKVWPVGIDTDFFTESYENKNYDFLIYFKKRDISELNFILKTLDKMDKKYYVIKYGSYDESHFLNIIHQSKHGIVIDNCESQGIAIQEMMSCNLPLLVYDVKTWNDRGDEYKCSATSIPYWDKTCGEFFYDICEFEEKIEKIENNIYNPRDFIIKNLSITNQCNKLLYE